MTATATNKLRMAAQRIKTGRLDLSASLPATFTVLSTLFCGFTASSALFGRFTVLLASFGRFVVLSASFGRFVLLLSFGVI